ncbi:pre-mRNA-splicing factor syf1, partial [Linderina pennispora]
FEVQHGNEDTFKEMLRIKRSVQARFNTDAHNLAAMEIEQKNEAKAKEQAQTQRQADAAAPINNPDEVAIDFDDEDL